VSVDEKMSDKISFSIFGSCVSRDLFEFDKQFKNRFEVREYIARQSIVSAVQHPIAMNVDELNVPYRFHRKLIKNDIEKTTFQLLRAAGSQYCMIDLIDERFRLGRVKDSILTLSGEFLNCSLFQADQIIECQKIRKHKDGREFLIDETPVDFYIDLFIQQLKQIYPSDHIILHRALNLDEYLSKEGNRLRFSEAVCKKSEIDNVWMEHMYDKILELIPEAIEIDCCRDYIAVENHKWNLAPMHYANEYYENVLQTIYSRI